MTRRRSRLEAVEVLYAADIRSAPVEDVLTERAEDDRPDPYMVELVCGVELERVRLDRVLAERSIAWPVSRMSPVDRNVLRVALFELLNDLVPGAVAIDEAVEIAKHFSGEDAGRFVNGILGAVFAERQTSGEGVP